MDKLGSPGTDPVYQKLRRAFDAMHALRNEGRGRCTPAGGVHGTDAERECEDRV